MKHASLPLLFLLAACSGERQLFRAPPDPGFGLHDAGISPAQPASFERALAWADARAAEVVRVHVAYVAAPDAEADGFELHEDDFTSYDLNPEAAALESDVVRWSLSLPPRPADRLLFWYFEAEGEGKLARLPADAPAGAIPVAIEDFVLDFEWPRWPQARFPFECNFDRSLYDVDYTVPGLPFEEVDAPLWVREPEATILGNSAGEREGIGIEMDGEAWFFPLAIMLWQEVANEDYEDRQSVMSYCPLTDTAVHFRHDNSGRADRFWDVGGLYNNNLVVSDPRTPQSKVPQMLAIGLDGALEGSCVEVAPSFLCDWNFWKRLYPDSHILNGDANISDIDWISRDNPYRIYWQDHGEIRFPVKHLDQSHPLGLHNKDHVLGILGGSHSPLALPLDVPGAEESFVYNSLDPARPFVAIWLNGVGFAGAFERVAPSDGTLLTFRFANVSYEGIRMLEDDADPPSLWTPMGVALAGPRAGERLAWVPSMRAFWFAWYAMYPHGDVIDPRATDAP